MAHVKECSGDAGGPKFSPPLYKQRYAAVVDLARKLQPSKVVDVGCAECKLLCILKRESYIEELVGVDIDHSLLRGSVPALRPLIYDYLHPRTSPLHISLLQGSIAHPDPRLKDFDLLTFVEVIEHLDQPVLDATSPAIFGFLRPHVVVMTTPNAEFNILFPNFSGFRHPDHRFEWTRPQFQAWCLAASRAYGYSVEFGGVGDPPADRQDVGPCSQMAVFTRSSDSSPHLPQHPNPQLSDYISIAEIDFPYRKDTLSPQEKLRFECEYYLHVLRKSLEAQLQTDNKEQDDDSESVRIPLEKLLLFPRVKALVERGLPDIRAALEGSIIALDNTRQFAIFPQEDASSTEEEEEEEDEEVEEEDEEVEEKTGWHGVATGDDIMPSESWD